MARKIKCCLILFLITFFLMQWKLTLFGGFFWPFSSHRLFSSSASDQKSLVQAIIIDADGHEQAVHPGRVIPIEYARCSGLVRQIACKRAKEEQLAFCNYLLLRLNRNPWWAFDEMFLAVSSPTKAPFVQLRFEIHEVENSVNQPTVTVRRALFP